MKELLFGAANVLIYFNFARTSEKKINPFYYLTDLLHNNFISLIIYLFIFECQNCNIFAEVSCNNTILIKSIVIIPTYNERENIERMVETVLSYPDGFHLLVIDDNSPDNTAEVIKYYGQKFPDKVFLIQRSGKLGLGTAYIAGFRWALDRGYEFIFEMDADFSHSPADLTRLLNACTNDGVDLAIGSRYISGVNVVNWPIGRILMSYCASMYVRFITRMPVRDTTAGFKCYRSKVLKTINLDKIRFKGYAFQIEMKFAAWSLGFNIKEIPIIFTERKLGESKMSGGIFNEAVWGVIRMKIRSLYNSYN